MAKNQAKAKQHPQAELLLFENYSLFSLKLFNNSEWSWSQSERSWFNVFQKFMSQHAINLNSLKLYIQTNDKFREVFTKHLKTFLESIGMNEGCI